MRPVGLSHLPLAAGVTMVLAVVCSSLHTQVEQTEVVSLEDGAPIAQDVAVAKNSAMTAYRQIKSAQVLRGKARAALRKQGQKVPPGLRKGVRALQDSIVKTSVGRLNRKLPRNLLKEASVLASRLQNNNGKSGGNAAGGNAAGGTRKSGGTLSRPTAKFLKLKRRFTKKVAALEAAIDNAKSKGKPKKAKQLKKKLAKVIKKAKSLKKKFVAKHPRASTKLKKGMRSTTSRAGGKRYVTGTPHPADVAEKKAKIELRLYHSQHLKTKSARKAAESNHKQVIKEAYNKRVMGAYLNFAKSNVPVPRTKNGGRLPEAPTFHDTIRRYHNIHDGIKHSVPPSL